MRKLLTIWAAVSSFTVLLWAPIVSAEETVCQGTLGPVTVDNLVVPDGATCTLNGTQVEGNVSVETGATLRARTIDVDGNIHAEGHNFVQVFRNSAVGGSIQVNQGNRAVIDMVTINGDVQLEQNTGSIRLTRNIVGANMQVNQNTGGVLIARNTIAQALQCQANDPAPTGGGNIVGDKEDQCAGL